MEPLCAIFRVVDTKSNKEKYGHVWIKKEEEAVVRARGAADLTERVNAVWVTSWRDEPSVYKLVHGDNSVPSAPDLDLAATLRTQFIKAKRPNSGPRWKRNDIASKRREEVRDLVVSLIQNAKDETKKPKKEPVALYVPPYIIRYAKEKENAS